jgi:hypothetical protein
MSKPKTETGPKWAILNPQLFALSEAENATINAHDALWAEHCNGGKHTDPLSIETEFNAIINKAEDGDLEALKLLKSFGTLEAYARYCRAEQAGRRRRFDRENCGTFEQVKSIAARAKARFHELLREYRDSGETTRKLLELSPVTSDDATARLERLIMDCAKVESHSPQTFEVLSNHLALTQIEEGEA